MTITRQQRTLDYQRARQQILHWFEHTDEWQRPGAQAQQLADTQAAFPHLQLTRRWMDAVLPTRESSQQSITQKRTSEEWASIFPRYPIEEDGFAKALSVSESAEIKELMDKYGLVVVNVLTEEECNKSIEAMFEELNRLPNERRKAQLDRHLPHTWEQDNWPTTSKYLVSDPAFHQKAFDNRSHELIYELFATLWEESRLMVNIDRWGIARGTRGLKMKESEGSYTLTDREDWLLTLTLHWDYNPWLFIKELESGMNPGYQGLVAFEDHDLETGCHLTLPGGVHFLKQWCLENEHPKKLGMKRQSWRPKPEDPILSHMQPIPIRKGDMVIWSWGQLHSTLPNANDKMRLHQYIGMFPAQQVAPFYAKHENFSPKKILPRYEDTFSIDDVQLTPLGSKLLGLCPW